MSSKVPLGANVSSCSTPGTSSGSSSESSDISLKLVDTTLSSLFHVFQTSSGIQELLPYFSQFFYSQISSCIDNCLHVLWNIVHIITALVQNPNVKLEFHIQQLLQAVLSTIVGGRVGTSRDGDDQYLLREYSARTVAMICRRYTPCIPDLTARVCKTYLDCFLPHREVTTVYGGVAGIRAMGYTFVKSMLLPKLGDILALLTKKKCSVEYKTGKLIFVKIQKCESIILSAVGLYITQCMKLPSAIQTGSAVGLSGKTARKKSRHLVTVSNALPSTSGSVGCESESNGSSATVEDGVEMDTTNIQEMRKQMKQMQEEIARLRAGGSTVSSTEGGDSTGDVVSPVAITADEASTRTGEHKRSFPSSSSSTAAEKRMKVGLSAQSNAIPYYTRHSDDVSTLCECRRFVCVPL